MKNVLVNTIDYTRIVNIVKKLILDGTNKFIIYPKGMVSEYVENIVVNLGGRIEYYIDNINYNGKNILNINQAVNKKNNAKILICSKNDRCFDVLRKNIYDAFEESRVIDLFWTYDSKIFVEKSDVFAGRFRTGKFLLDSSKNTEDKIPKDIYEELDFLSIQLKNINMEKTQKEKYEELFIFIKNSVENGLICRHAGNHFIPNYEFVINNGIDFLVDYYSKNLEYVDLLKKFSDYILKYSDKASECGNNRIEESCKIIAHKKPQCLFDAIQLIIMIHEVLVSESGCGSLSFGRIDQYLFPFYNEDINKGVVTKEEVQQYIVAFFKKLSEFSLSWQNVTIGGCDLNWKDQSNDLTIMCMRAVSIIKGDQPQLSLRICKNTNDKVWDEAINLLSQGMGFPALFNDEVAIAAKMNCGVNISDAYNYAVMGCVELSIPGKEYAHTEGARLNWAKVLEELLNDIYNDKITEKLNSFGDFLNHYIRYLYDRTIKLCDFIDFASGMYPKKWSVPFASIMMDGTKDTCRDVTDNGTIYNNLAINSVGVATSVDSLQAIKELIYCKKILSLEKLAEICVTGKDFEKYKKEMLNCRKYGNDCDEVDDIAVKLIELFNNWVCQYQMKYRNGKIMPWYYTSYFHADFGYKTCATPDGRVAYSPLSPSLSASSGKDKNGILALFNSANKINMSSMSNGAALDIKFMPQFFNKEENRNALRAVIEIYFNKGGLETQINVVDKQVLLDAKEHPEKHMDLIVRVSGFSAKFVNLDSELQDEIIKRTEMR